MDININYASGESAVQKLTSLREECDGLTVAAEEPCGSGNVVDVICELNNTLKETKTALTDLIDKTTTFLNNCMGNMQSADEYSASNMLKEGESK